jgi:hypothetical protein
MKILNSIPICVVVLCLSVQADDKQTNKEKAANNFAFEKTTLGTTFESFMKRFPKALTSGSRSKEQIQLIVVERYDCDSASKAEYWFLDGKLFSIAATYGDDRLERLDEGNVLLEKMIDKLGVPTKGWTPDQDIHYVRAAWEFPKQNRLFSLRRVPNIGLGITGDAGVHLDLTDTKLADEYQKRLAKYQRSGTTGIE